MSSSGPAVTGSNPAGCAVGFAKSVSLKAVWGGMGGGHRLGPCGFATVVALGVLILATAYQPALGEARAATTEPAAVGQDLLRYYGPYSERSLMLELPGKLVVGRRATVRAEGNAVAGDELSVFVDPQGKQCPSAASAEPARAISLISEVTDEGAFRVEETYRPQSAGSRTFCAYLGASVDQADVQASEHRRVSARRLQASVARRTVVTALKRHGFARRVVKSVHVDCRRRSRNAFGCKFSDRLPGYRLRGGGQVKLGVDLSYSFRVTAQGVRLTLTDDNEAPRSH
jgi:hypothetical protein